VTSSSKQITGTNFIATLQEHYQETEKLINDPNFTIENYQQVHSKFGDLIDKAPVIAKFIKDHKHLRVQVGVAPDGKPEFATADKLAAYSRQLVAHHYDAVIDYIYASPQSAKHNVVKLKIETYWEELFSKKRVGGKDNHITSGGVAQIIKDCVATFDVAKAIYKHLTDLWIGHAAESLFALRLAYVKYNHTLQVIAETDNLSKEHQQNVAKVEQHLQEANIWLTEMESDIADPNNKFAHHKNIMRIYFREHKNKAEESIERAKSILSPYFKQVKKAMAKVSMHGIEHASEFAYTAYRFWKLAQDAYTNPLHLLSLPGLLRGFVIGTQGISLMVHGAGIYFSAEQLLKLTTISDELRQLQNKIKQLDETFRAINEPLSHPSPTKPKIQPSAVPTIISNNNF
jgi:hypothetical protein